MTTVAEAFSQAVRHHGAGRFVDAARIYQQILTVNPQNPDALHLLGLATFQHGSQQPGIDCIRQAIALRGNDPVMHNNLGLAYQGMLDHARALICFGRLLQLVVPQGQTADYQSASLDQPLPSFTAPPATPVHAPQRLYLDLMKRCLTNLIYQDMNTHHEFAPAFDLPRRTVGSDWPAHAHTMIGLRRLENIQCCVEQILADNIPGDLLEAGVWRGGATIFMRAMLKAHDIRDRVVWVADSFQGVPVADCEKYPQDAKSTFSSYQQLAVSLEQVQENFRRYNLLDDQVKFVKGWFRDTLATAPVRRLALLRLDGDLYESTMDGLVHLYPRLSPGGYVIIDDFINIRAAREAALEYRKLHGITDEIKPVDWSAVYWRKSEPML